MKSQEGQNSSVSQVLIASNGSASLGTALATDGLSLRVLLNDNKSLSGTDKVRLIIQTGPAAFYNRTARMVSQIEREIVLEFTKPLGNAVLADLLG
ncbi:MAG TPA: hypothetical protein EYO33_00135 [Phycisphaerales bacterium]|nr:hypothetical protein [Phycisphaerales bacterium]